MTAFVAFLRAVNVAGHRKVAMADLRRLHESLGHRDVATLLQSGNVVFESEGAGRAALTRAIEAAYARELGIETEVMLRDAAEIAAIVEGCPLALGPEREARFLHAVMLTAPPERAALERRMAWDGPEEIAAGGDTLHVYYANGVGRSKLTTAVLERTLGVRATGRNWNTMIKLRALVAASAVG